MDVTMNTTNNIDSTYNSASSSTQATSNAQSTTNNTQTAADESTKNTQEKVSDIYEKTNESKSNYYKFDKTTVNKMLLEAEMKAAQFSDMVTKSANKQGHAYATANFDTLLKSFYNSDSNQSDIAQLIKGLNPDAETIAQAQKDIADGGYWSAEKTAERIVDFAVALSGGDPDRLAEMEAAFEKGFKKAAAMWGDELPAISNNTYDLVKKGFENAKNGTSGLM